MLHSLWDQSDQILFKNHMWRKRLKIDKNSWQCYFLNSKILSDFCLFFYSFFSIFYWCIHICTVFLTRKVMGLLQFHDKPYMFQRFAYWKCHGTWIIPVLHPLGIRTPEGKRLTSPATAFISALSFHRSPLLHCKQPHLPSTWSPNMNRWSPTATTLRFLLVSPLHSAHDQVLGLVFFTTWWYFYYYFLLSQLTRTQWATDSGYQWYSLIIENWYFKILVFPFGIPFLFWMIRMKICVWLILFMC